jgi:hypothetical protein
MKEYHFGVVATFDEDTSRWEFDATTVGGDSPFMEMDYEVFDPDRGDSGTWECAWMTAEPGSIERVNFELLVEAIEHANYRLKEDQ